MGRTARSDHRPERRAYSPGAHIGANSNTLPRGITTQSDERGSYALPVLPIGVYTITVSAPGFHTLLYHNLEVRLGLQLTFNARMSLGSVSDSIDVNEPLAPADLSSSQTATQINANAFEALARGKSFHTILMMAPGVRNEAKAARLASAGSRLTAPAVRRTATSSMESM